ncbi:hypothetical protein [Streptomyces ziwulingensis]|uniref:Uncharacterized protein n=1 Tax=Streptomyces ziwulingensis TaxID=1045501 RepID=A0ABP9CTE9_9ACTN
MDSDKNVCPACGQTVETVVRRHKTLGAWVPVWVPGPCHDPTCPATTETSLEPPGPSARPANAGPARTAREKVTEKP